MLLTLKIRKGKRATPCLAIISCRSKVLGGGEGGGEASEVEWRRMAEILKIY